MTELENILINVHKAEMIAFMHAHPKCLNEAIELAIANKQPFSWRAAWLLWSCIEENDERVKKHIKKLIKGLKGKADGHQRELLKIIHIMDLSEKDESFMFDWCVDVWKAIDKKPSVRYNAFKYLKKLSKKYPDLKNEIALYTDDRYLKTLSPGVKNGIIKML